MKFQLRQASRWHDEVDKIVAEHEGSYVDKQGRACINITSIKQLLSFIDSCEGGSVVINRVSANSQDWEILDYDDYIE